MPTFQHCWPSLPNHLIFCSHSDSHAAQVRGTQDREGGAGGGEALELRLSLMAASGASDSLGPTRSQWRVEGIVGGDILRHVASGRPERVAEYIDTWCQYECMRYKGEYVCVCVNINLMYMYIYTYL